MAKTWSIKKSEVRDVQVTPARTAKMLRVLLESSAGDTTYFDLELAKATVSEIERQAKWTIDRFEATRPRPIVR